ncbi:hypothetical protein evm_004725 [Chilo suppressalis]|nr:hypothetical protein evm_004725 [Chilo suppressalis]
MQARRPSPARSQSTSESPRRHQPRKTRSVGSPARSTASGRLSSIIPIQGNIMDSFNLSPMPTRRSVLNDDTDIGEPRRKSWWKRLSNNSRDVMEALNDNKMLDINEAVEELIDIEVLSQEKKNYTMDIPESSDNETISSIVIPQRKLFTQKENQPQKKFGQLIGTRESLAKLQKTTSNDKTLHVAPKKLFNQQSKPKSKPIFPSALLNISPNKTVNKTKEMAGAEPRVEVRTLFGNRAGTKRKNMFADFIVSESEDDISEIQPRVFGFQNKGEKQKEASNAYRREQSPTSSIATDTEMDEWKLLPSSTMVENELEDMMATARTPVKRARLFKLLEDKKTENTETPKTNRTKQLNQSKTSDKSENHSESLLKNKSHVKNQNQQAGEKDGINVLDVNHQIQEEIYVKNVDDEQQQDVGLLQNEDEFPVAEDITITNNKSNTTPNKKLGISITVPLSNNNKSTVVDTSITSKVCNDVNISLNRTKQLNISKILDTQPVTNISINKSKSQNKSKTSNKSMNSSNPKKAKEVQSKIEDPNLPHKSGFSHEVQDNLENELENYNAQEEDLHLHYESEEDLQRNEACQRDQENGKIKNAQIENLQQRKLDKESDELSKKNLLTGNLSLQSKTKARSELQDEQDKKSDHQQNRTENQEIHDKTEKMTEKSSQEKDKVSDMDVHEDSQSEEDNLEEHEASDVGFQEEQEETDLDDQEKYENDDENIQEESDEENAHSGLENKDEHNESNEANNEVDEESDVDNHEEHEESIVDIQEESDAENQEAHAEGGEADQDEIEENDEQNPVIHEEDGEENIEDQEETDEENMEVQEDSFGEDQEEQNESEEEEVEERNEETQEELDNYDQQEEENQEAAVDSSAEIQDTDEDDEQNGEGISQEIDNEDIQDNEIADASQDTTGRHRKKEGSKVNSPEAVLHDKTKQMESIVAKGRNTSLRRTSIMMSMNLRASLAPPRESTGFSDGTKNSSAEGSGWDSHRTTRKTLRQTFGKDFSPRKSLRALVMEKTAKRLTSATDITSKFPQGNSTELPETSDIQDDHGANVSNHDVSKRTRQTTLELYLQKIKKETMERKIRMEEVIRNSLKAPPKDLSNPFKVPSKTMFPLKKSSRTPLQNKSKPKQTKSTHIKFDNLPPEMIEDMKYKPPKRFRPSNAAWITKRLYKHIETKLEPKYDYKARLRSEKLVETVYNFSKQLRRHHVAPKDMVDELKHEMARLDVVKTHFEFYQFFHDFMPREIRIKVVPDIVNEIPLPRHGIFSDILRNNTVQG